MTSAGSLAAPPPHAAGMFASLHVRNYRWYITGQTLSNVGNWMNRVAQDWLVIDLTGSSLAVGVATALQFGPVLVLGLWGGLLADRYPKRTLLLLSQAVMGLLAAIAAVLAFTGTVELMHLYLLSFGLGLATVVNNPARQSFVSELVGGDLVPNGIALNAASFQLARLVGPAIAGVAVATAGAGWAFAANAVGYVPAIATLCLLRRAELMPSRPVSRARGQLSDGLRYVLSAADLRWRIMLVVVIGIFGMSLPVLLASYAKEVFDAGADVYGLLTSATAVGAVLGAFVAARRGVPGLRVLFAWGVAFGFTYVCLGLTPWLPVFALLLVVSGWCSVTVLTMANSGVQMLVDPSYRGRVLALYGIVMLGGTPLGAPMLGALTEAWGAPTTMIVAGSVILCASLLLSWLVAVERGLRLSFDGGVQVVGRPPAGGSLEEG